MLRTLLATTALTALLAGGAHAQEQDQQSSQDANGGLDIQATTTQTDSAAAAGQGQQVTVRSGDTIVIEPSNEGTFTLNFQFGGATGTMQPGTPQTPEQAVQRENLQQGDPSQLSVDNLMDSDVYGANDENIGNVGDVLLTEEGDVDAMIVDVGGFLGIGSRQVAIGVDNLQFMVDENNTWYVFTPFTQEQLENHPEYNESTYGTNGDQRLTAQN